MIPENDVPVIISQELIFELGSRPDTLLQVCIIKEFTTPFAPHEDMCLMFTVLRDEYQFPTLPHIDDALRTVIIDRVCYEPEERLFTAYCSWVLPSGMVARMENGLPIPAGSLHTEEGMDNVKLYLETHGWEIADVQHLNQKSGASQPWNIIYGN